MVAEQQMGHSLHTVSSSAHKLVTISAETQALMLCSSGGQGQCHLSFIEGLWLWEMAEVLFFIHQMAHRPVY